MEIKMTTISDTHSKHRMVDNLLEDGELIIHSGDISVRGFETEVSDFLNWYSSLYMYDNKIFIPGNHDFYFQEVPDESKELLSKYPDVIMLEDNMHTFKKDGEEIKIWGYPWTPKFGNFVYNHELNIYKNIDQLDMIPSDVDILISHGPMYSILDYVNGRHVGSQHLADKIISGYFTNLKMVIFGHIHSSYGYKQFNNIHFINCAVLNNYSVYKNKPVNFIWNSEDNMINFI